MLNKLKMLKMIPVVRPKGMEVKTKFSCPRCTPHNFCECGCKWTCINPLLSSDIMHRLSAFRWGSKFSKGLINEIQVINNGLGWNKTGSWNKSIGCCDASWSNGNQIFPIWISLLHAYIGEVFRCTSHMEQRWNSPLIWLAKAWG